MSVAADDAAACVGVSCPMRRGMLVGHLKPAPSPIVTRPWRWLTSLLSSLLVRLFFSFSNLYTHEFYTTHARAVCVTLALSCCPFRDPTFPVFLSFLFMMIQKASDRSICFCLFLIWREGTLTGTWKKREYRTTFSESPFDACLSLFLERCNY